MSKLQENLEKVKRLFNIQQYYGSVDRIMYWDFFRSLPPAGRPYMGQVGDFLREEARKHIVNDETRELADYFRGIDPASLENDFQRACARDIVKMYDATVQMPLELVNEQGKMSSESQMFWQECYHKADWKSFKPYMKKAFDLRIRTAQAIDPNRPVFDVLVGQVEEGLTVDRIGELFTQLREGIVDILGKVREAHAAIDISPLKVQAPIEVRKELVRKAALAVGFDFEKGTMGERMHPYCGLIGPRDSRPSPNYDMDLFGSTVAIHECGHGMYGYSSSDEAIEWGLWGGIGGAMHEGQARFLENKIGKSREFWINLYPEYQAAVPELRNYDLDAFYKALICARPGLKRTQADELTYNLHLILRFELEKAYFEGKISIDDLEEAWNQKYEEYFGIRPQNAREGILQDMHWGIGLVGYFQSYTLGDMSGAQMRHKMLQEIPDAYQQLARGDVSPMIGWLEKNIWRHGLVYTPDDLLLRCTGEELNAKYCVDYLSEKYLATV